MASKGVDYYFINSSGFNLDAQGQNTDESQAFGPISISYPPFETTGNAQITWEFPYVFPYGSVQFSTNANPPVLMVEQINAVTGNSSGQLSNMMQTPSIIGSDYDLSYGFFDAGTGDGTGLTDQDQIYAYLTPTQQNWMGALATQYASVNNAPFASFVLPGAHDAGTFDLTQVNQLCNDAQALTALAGVMLAWFPGAQILLNLLAAQLEGVIIGEAVTQKDDIVTMLNLGCRYFDFRPGYVPDALRPFLSGIYHIHSVIPGYPLSNFFVDVLTWLVNNPSEIVVIGLANSGFLDPDMIPSATTLESALVAAQQEANASSIQIGQASDLQTSYGQLIAANKRLFFLNEPNLTWLPANKYDSYNSDYNTTDPAVILNALESMTKAGQAGYDYTVLQLQATATGQNVLPIVISLADSLSSAYEPLMSTKPLMDSNTYPWVLANAGNLSDTNLLVLLNDFVDNALAGLVASQLTLSRSLSTAAKIDTSKPESST